MSQYPLTDLIVALMRMEPAHREAASAERAAERYGVPIERCRYWIDHYRTQPGKVSRKRRL